MKINIHHIPSMGLDLVFEKPAHFFPALQEMIQRGECDFGGPVSIQLRIREEKDFIKVEGHLMAMLHLACARCLNLYDNPVDCRFTLTYSNRIPSDVHRKGAGEIELTAEQIGVLFFKGDEIDLTEALQEQVVLAIPFRPLCREQCKGLCSQCGKDLNQGPCQCGNQKQDGPFAVLKDLTLPE
jgi:uncharacterized protein